MEYIGKLIFTMLATVYIEMTFPSSEAKKYLKLMLSFIVVLVILSPVVEVVKQMSDGKDILGGHLMYYQNELGIQTQYSKFEEEQRRQQESLKEVYTKQVNRQVKEVVESKLPISVKSTEVKMSEKDLEFFMEEIELIVEVADESDEIGIAQIKIGDKTESITLNETYLKEEIKSCLNDFYNWDKDNIYITVDYK